MRSRNFAIVGVLLIVACVCLYGWFRYVTHPSPVACGYCLRPLHANLMVTAEIAGKRTRVCCARCAITEANQEHKPLRLIEVHDFPTGKAIAPENAWFVASVTQPGRRTGARRGGNRETFGGGWSDGGGTPGPGPVAGGPGAGAGRHRRARACDGPARAGPADRPHRAGAGRPHRAPRPPADLAGVGRGVRPLSLNGGGLHPTSPKEVCPLSTDLSDTL